MGIANIINNSTTTSGGEIVRELVNSSDGQGLHFDGSGSISGTSNLALGSKYSAEFVINYTGSANNRLFDINGDTRFIVEFNRSGFTGKIAGYDSDFYELCDIPDDGVFHLTVTVDGTAVSAYINGNLAGTATKNNSTSIDTVTQWTIGANDGGSFGHFAGTIYRARFYNKALTSAEVRTAFERSDVPFADQYGENNLVDADASVFTSGTYSWVAYGSNTIANVGNALEITYGNAANGAYNYFRNSSDLKEDLIVGKKYRLTVDAKYTGGSAGSTLVIGSVGTAFATLTTSMVTYTTEFTATQATTDNLRCGGMSAGNVVTIDNWQLDEIGCVSDYQTQWANPTQSLIVQDASGAADGTCSASGVTQVQPVVQLNSTSARIGTTAATPADGEVIANKGKFDGDNSATPLTVNGGTLSVPSVQLNGGTNQDDNSSIQAKYSLVLASNSTNAIANRSIVFKNGTETQLTISSNGNLTANGDATVENYGSYRNLVLRRAQGTSASPTTIANTQTLGKLSFSGYTGSVYREGATIVGKVSEHVGGDEIPSSLVFSTTANGATSPTPRLSIDSTGNIEQHTDSNGIVKFGVKNESTGTAARAMVNVLSDSGNLDLSMNGSNYTGVAGWADSGTISTGSGASGGLKMNAVVGGLALQTNQTTRLSIANSTGLATFSGDLECGAVSATGASVGWKSLATTSSSGPNTQTSADNTGTRGHYLFYNPNGEVGSIKTSGSATSFNTSSDYRLKENLTPLTGALDRLDALPVYRFNFKADPDTTVDGFVAHEVQAHVPEAITGEKDAMKTVVVQEAVEAVEAQPATYWQEGDELPEGVAVGDEKTAAVEAVEAVAEVTEEQPDYQGIDQSKLVPLLVAAVKELAAKVKTLENA